MARVATSAGAAAALALPGALVADLAGEPVAADGVVFAAAAARPEDFGFTGGGAGAGGGSESVTGVRVPPRKSSRPAAWSLSLLAVFMASVRPCWTAHLPTMRRSEEHTSELQSLMRISYAVCC